MTYTATKLLSLSSSELDNLFKSGTVGPCPNGEATGTAIIAPGTVISPEIAELINLFCWKGKVFDASKMTLVNKITAFGLTAILAKIEVGPSWVDGKECLILDYSHTSHVAHWIRDEIRLIGPGLYIGKVFWSKEDLIHFALQF